MIDSAFCAELAHWGRFDGPTEQRLQPRGGEPPSLQLCLPQKLTCKNNSGMSNSAHAAAGGPLGLATH
jgi:hypothetical protein